jgi:hypothetical protein
MNGTCSSPRPPCERSGASSPDRSCLGGARWPGASGYSVQVDVDQEGAEAAEQGGEREPAAGFGAQRTEAE